MCDDVRRPAMTDRAAIDYPFAISIGWWNC
jgi:hypothetical protein